MMKFFFGDYRGIENTIEFEIIENEILIHDIYIEFPDKSKVDILQCITHDQYEHFYNMLKCFLK
jgi:hypothetical protein